MSKNKSKSSPSNHSSLAHLLFLPGVGHVAPDSYSGYGSLLDSDVDDDSEVTSAYYLQSNTVVPDSIPDEVHACVDEKGNRSESPRSDDLSPNTKSFNKFVSKFLEKQREKDKKRADDWLASGGKMGTSNVDSVDLSSKTKKFNDFYSKQLEKMGKKR